MRISNRESAKKQAILKFPAFTVGAAIIFLMISFITFWNGPINYREQTKQSDWPVTDATVSFVYQYYEAFHSASGRGCTLYDIYYDYYVDDQIYSGIIEERHAPQNLGDTFKIKYNPEAPEEHTRTLAPSKSYLVTGSIFGALGLTMVILTIVSIKKGKALKRQASQ